jgi:2-isopropylmalate synthase
LERGENQYWDIPYLPIDPDDIGCSYEAIIRVNSQSGKGGIAYLVKEHLRLDLPRRMQISFYQVIQAISDREAREMTVEDITTAFRKTYRFGGSKYEGRLVLRSFKISSEPADNLNTNPEDSDDASDERRRFDGTISVDGVVRVVRGDGNGPLSALLDALRTNLNIDFTIRDYSEHTVDEGKEAKAASYVEIVANEGSVKDTRKATQSWWGVGLATDIAGSGLRAVLSAVNSAIGDRALPELSLTVGFGSNSGQADVASAIVNSLELEMPRRLQSTFFEVVQRHAKDSGKTEISHGALAKLFQDAYGYDLVDPGSFAMKKYRMEHVETASRLTGEFIVGNVVRELSGEGNGPLSALLSALHPHIEGKLTIREYSEHSIGEGSGVRAASYVELVYEQPGKKRAAAWGVSADNDITASGLKAVLNAASNLDIVTKS